ncbi:hypothetical protein R1sor_008300 [Riccia sorocarpa]|uniref:Uncharacterized protein n=1 Tax=Riccia sorocarpa TaxID=122646 RepID=A0ABD3HWF1_9MARC
MKKYKKPKLVVDLDNEEEDDLHSKAPSSDEQTRTLIALSSKALLANKKKMVVSCHNFTKMAEACKKKWLSEFKKYKAEKFHNSVSGNDHQVTCKFYDDIDLHSENSIHVKKTIHGDASGSENPRPVEEKSVTEIFPSGCE